MILGNSTIKRSHNLHFIRFLAAILVIFSHSFTLTTGNTYTEPLKNLTKGQISFGDIAVSIFFLFSGYLIVKSVYKTKNFIPYFKARTIRILPPLIFVVVSCVVLGSFFTSLGLKSYFTSLKTWKYLLNGILVLIHDLPGVFSNNPYTSTVNGALWTLPVEFLCYIVCFIFYKLKLLKKKTFIWTVPLIPIAIIMRCFLPDLIKAMIRPCVLFYIGMGIFVYKDYIELNIKYALFAIVPLVISFYFNMGEIALYLFFPYIMFVLAFGIPQISETTGILGNYSYGIYLWGYPIQQALIQVSLNKIHCFINFIVSSILAIVFGIITYYLTEKNLCKLFMGNK